MNKLELGQKIRALRKERKQTLETLAEAADIGLVYLGEIERGIKMPSLKTRLLCAKAVRTDAVVDAGGDRRSALHSGNDDTTSEKAEK